MYIFTYKLNDPYIHRIGKNVNKNVYKSVTMNVNMNENKNVNVNKNLNKNLNISGYKSEDAQVRGGGGVLSCVILLPILLPSRPLWLSSLSLSLSLSLSRSLLFSVWSVSLPILSPCDSLCLSICLIYISLLYLSPCPSPL